ncbi:hypothetical protein SA2016_0147 [Sinomonas atrocyanea]|uniref:Uncharacterized protein n=1 Tax=Sinomonas atrocyanea TaxID=37927 RepID=A0A126ZUL5_9MICC|nr:hypothetical protein [Sinomonas atrocyanea]AMM30849.1 hypothetical protein SA2016_0147 [Sinomonas atrocyanea]GEB64984.1 hypothetical protein SAT01_24320 [Sinomonas atrocyanea]GGG68793.1 hypothetical protein GCM10007172_20980 [Sinomonas atrocyanea]
MTNAEMARLLGDLASPVAVIANFMDTDEIMRAVRAVMEKP